ncbi:MAG: ATP-binding protein [Balneola sp.]
MVFITYHPWSVNAQNLDLLIPKEDELVRLNQQFISAKDDTTRYFISKHFYYLHINDDTELALEVAQQALRYAQLANLEGETILSYLDLGNVYQKQAEFEKAFENFSIGLKLFEKYKPNQNLPLINFHIGVTYLDLHMYEIAEDFLEKARDSFVDKRDKSLPAYELFRVNILKGDTASALKYIHEFEGMIPEKNGEVNVDYLFHYAVLSEAYVRLGYFDKASTVLSRATPYIERHNRRYYRGIINIALSYISKNKGDLDEAIQYALTALDLFELQKENFYLIKTLDLLADLYSEKDDFEKAFECLKRYDSRQDKLLKARQSAIQNRLSDQVNEAEKASAELDAIEDRLKERQIYFTILLISFLISVLLAAWAYRLMKQRAKSSHEISRINDDKNHFIGVVSHDLRSPLNSIMALSSLLNDDPAGSPPEEIKEFSSIILNSSKRMETLINNMLDVNKIETGNTRLELLPTSIKGIIAEIAESMSHLGNEKNITTEIKIDDDLPIVMADGIAVARVLENLISNAYKFSPKQSTVSILATSDDGKVQIVVKDQGHGMSDLDRSKLFQKFEKLSASPTGNEKSTGLGLYIVKNLMAEMKGTVLVESELNRGTSFKLLFNKA